MNLPFVAISSPTENLNASVGGLEQDTANNTHSTNITEAENAPVGSLGKEMAYSSCNASGLQDPAVAGASSISGGVINNSPAAYLIPRFPVLIDNFLKFKAANFRIVPERYLLADTGICILGELHLPSTEKYAVFTK